MTDAQIENLLGSAYELGSSNELSVRAVREWLGSYIDAYMEDLARFPEQKGSPPWDMVVADHDRNRSSLFVCAFFGKEQAKLVAGTGDCDRVRDFIDRGFPNDASAILEEINKRFTVGQIRIEIPLQELLDWLG